MFECAYLMIFRIMCIIFLYAFFFFFSNKKLSSDAMDVEGVFERMCWCYLMYAVVVRCILCHAMVSVNRRCVVFEGSFLFFAHFLREGLISCGEDRRAPYGVTEDSF